jgi:hypothetical protein
MLEGPVAQLDRAEEIELALAAEIGRISEEE